MSKKTTNAWCAGFVAGWNAQAEMKQLRTNSVPTPYQPNANLTPEPVISAEEEGSNDKLLPCPFCGGEAKVIGEVEMWFQPACMTRGCACVWTEFYATKAEAAAAWNTRAERMCNIEMAEVGFNSSGDSFYHSICSECGAYLHEGDNYCPNCGTKVVK